MRNRGNRQLTLETILPFKMNVVARPGDTRLKTQIFRGTGWRVQELFGEVFAYQIQSLGFSLQ